MRFATGALALGLMLAGCEDAAEPEVDEETYTPAETTAAAGGVIAGASGEEGATESAPAGQKTVACADTERTVFSCKIGNGKRISICAVPGGDVEYRFGKGMPELVLPASIYASTAYSGGGELQVGFVNGATRYVVFSRSIRTNFNPGEPNNTMMSDGVIVERGEEVLNIQVCDDPNVQSIDYDVVDELLPANDELLSFETERGDPSGEGGM